MKYNERECWRVMTNILLLACLSKDRLTASVRLRRWVVVLLVTSSAVLVFGQRSINVFSSSTTTTQWQTAAHGSSGKSAPINQTLWILFILITLYTLLPEKVSNIQCCSEYPSSKIWQILGFWESRLDDHRTGKRDICQDSPPINDAMATLYLPEIYSLH